MRTFVACAGLAAAALCHAAAAEPARPSSAYVQLNAGAGVAGALRANGQDVILGPVAVREDLKIGGMVSALVGRRLGDGALSMEGEGIHLDNRIGSPDLDAALGVATGLHAKTYGGLVNLKLDAPAFGPPIVSLTPYVAAGVGYGHEDLTILGDHYTGDGMLWQVKAGLTFQTMSRLGWDLGYRYVSEPTFNTDKLGLTAKLKTDAHVLSAGVRYSF
jgi:opacity protein-like surface antigen